MHVRHFRPSRRELSDFRGSMLVSLVSIVSFQPLPRTTLSNGRVSRAAASMQLPQMPDFGKSLQNMMPGGGDDSGLSKEQAEEMEARMKTGGMTFDDFLMQTKVMQKAGSMQAMMKKMPFGVGGSISDEQYSACLLYTSPSPRDS